MKGKKRAPDDFEARLEDKVEMLLPIYKNLLDEVS
jgi:hypothetical protein